MLSLLTFLTHTPLSSMATILRRSIAPLLCVALCAQAQTGFRLVTASGQTNAVAVATSSAQPERVRIPSPKEAVGQTVAAEKSTPVPRPTRVPKRKGSTDESAKAPKEVPTPDAGEMAAIALAANTSLPQTTEAILRPGMQISVMVYLQGKVEITIPDQRINEAGKISLPLLREVGIAPGSLRAAEELITEAYGAFYRNPQVVIAFVGNEKDPLMSPWGYVTVMGRVNKEGRVAIPPTRNLTVSSAIQLSGGSASSANESSIVVYRPQADGQPVKIQVDLQNMARKGDQGEDIILLSGDVVYVPERIF